MTFKFGEFTSCVYITKEIPDINTITDELNNVLIIADENTAPIAAKIYGNKKLPICILSSGEENKNWKSVETILKAAFETCLGRDCIFIAVGGGVIGDIAGFAASIYMRGCRYIHVSTTLLGMVDASVGGKTGFDLFNIKNLIGSFFPAEKVFIPINSLSTLPDIEWKSGMAELIKTAILDSDDFLDQLIIVNTQLKNNGNKFDYKLLLENDLFGECIKRAVLYKGCIVTEDLRETGKRKLLNLGHTFGHALESAAGLGNISHGEAVAWGIIRACDLGLALGITPVARAKKIKEMIYSFGYECTCPHPLAPDINALITLMKSDKKKKQGKLTFIIPDEKSARPVIIESEDELNLLKNILKGQSLS
ncbi:MAG: 3-dehydroquinate synthase [Treponema sp.]|nr:3-dehydroquinate synthase [Treponema sp.]